MNDDSTVCCRCMEDFPIAAPSAALRMGLLFDLDRFTERFKRLVGNAATPYICGNCYFDLTDE